MSENLHQLLLAKMAEAREKKPDLRELSEAEVVLLSSTNFALTKGSETLAQYGSIDIALMSAGLASIIAIATKTAWSITEHATKTN